MHALQLDKVEIENWEGFPFRTLLAPGAGHGLEIYELQVTHDNPHLHDGYDQVYIVKEGRGTMRIGDETQAVGPGWLVYIPRGQQHSLEPLDGSPVILYSIVHHLDGAGQD